MARLPYHLRHRRIASDGDTDLRPVCGSPSLRSYPALGRHQWVHSRLGLGRGHAKALPTGDATLRLADTSAASGDIGRVGLWHNPALSFRVKTDRWLLAVMAEQLGHECNGLDY